MHSVVKAKYGYLRRVWKKTSQEATYHPKCVAAATVKEHARGYV